ncbi:MAG: histidine ammonia-lyase [Candidatus Neomarinimicrobiota bacterium]
MSREPVNFNYGEQQLTPRIALDIARGKCVGQITAATREKIERSCRIVDKIVAGTQAVYGINTGFGPLCTTPISAADTERLQANILRSHSAGVGDPVPVEIARLMLILKIQALAKGHSGIRPATLERIIWMVDNNITPVVPSQGSVGASGDLAPLAHLFLPLIGLGEIHAGARIRPGGEALTVAGLAPLRLGAKEGLALINGTQFITAHAVLALERFQNCLDNADIIGAMTLEALLGSVRPFADELHSLRAFDGSRHVAYCLRRLLQGSAMTASHADCQRVQDPYSLRCMPQVHGASRTAWRHLLDTVLVELDSVTDNPVILADGTTISGGNFHGQPLALPLDYAVLAASELGNISDRRTYLLLDGEFSGLPKLLMRDIGINSGFMIPQYTSAALVSENKNLCFPASADSIPTSLGQEDHVSMGSISGRKLLQVIDNLENILAVELVSAAQAFDFREPLQSSPILEACHDCIRAEIDHAREDRVFAADLAAAREIIRSGRLADCARQAAAAAGIDLSGPLGARFEL